MLLHTVYTVSETSIYVLGNTRRIIEQLQNKEVFENNISLNNSIQLLLDPNRFQSLQSRVREKSVGIQLSALLHKMSYIGTVETIKRKSNNRFNFSKVDLRKNQ